MHTKTENMPKKILFSLILSCFSIGVQAVSLGSLHVLSEKNQPLKAELDLGSLSESELRALKLEFSSSDNTDFKAYGIQSTIEKKGKTYFAKIITAKPLPLNVLDLRVKSSINGQLIEKSYSNLLKGSHNRPIDTNDVIKANPVPAKSNKSAKPPDSPLGHDGKYRVKDGDNLYSISGSHSKNLQDVSLDQVIVAIYQSNPQAFNNGNMNRLRSGSELSLPTSEQVAGIDPKSAKLEITARTTQYSKYRNKVINFVNRRTPETQATTSQKGNVTTQPKQVQITENAKDNLQLKKSGINDKKEQDIVKQLNNQESKQLQDQNKAIEESKKELEQKKQMLTSSVEQNASKTEVPPPVASSTNIQEDERHTNPLGLLTSSTNAAALSGTIASETQENKTQGTIATTPDIAGKTQLAVKNKNTGGIWPFLIMLSGAGGIGYFVYKRRKKQELEEEQDSLFVHGSKTNSSASEYMDNESDLNSDFNNISSKNDNLLQNALNSKSANNRHKDQLDEGFDGDLSNFNLGVNENFAQSSNDNLNNNDDHLFADNIPLIDDLHKDNDLFKDNTINLHRDNNQALIEDSNVPYKSEVGKSMDDINFDDIPTLSFEDQIENPQSQGNSQDILNTDTYPITESSEPIEHDQFKTAKEPESENNKSEQKDNGFYETKLELAKAYLDIEDFSGASMLLEELIAQNEDKKVQKQAKALLKDINEI